MFSINNYINMSNLHDIFAASSVILLYNCNITSRHLRKLIIEYLFPSLNFNQIKLGNVFDYTSDKITHLIEIIEIYINTIVYIYLAKINYWLHVNNNISNFRILL
jgi:hypothetical protein